MTIAAGVRGAGRVTRYVAILRRCFDNARMFAKAIAGILAIALLAALPAPGAGGSAGAAVSASAPATLIPAQSDGGKSLDQAVAEVRRRYGGQILRAETRVENCREMHYVKVLTDGGRVRTVKIRGRRRC